jgi:hypothetical protein
MYSPAAMFGVHFQRSSDGASIGMVTRGGGYNDYNLLINWGDDSGDILEWRFNNSRVALMDIGGQSQFPIVYDYNDTSWYSDPNSTSQLQFIECRRYGFRYPGGDSGLGADAYNLFQEGGGWGYPYPDLRIAYHTGIKFGANPSYEGMRFYNDYPMGSLLFQVNGGSNYQYKYTWQYTDTGGYYSGYNSAHWYPNYNSSYGSWRADGSRNGWYGFNIGTGNNPHVMFDGSGNGGMYMEGYGRWLYYHYLPYNCIGINTSSTSPSYGMYVSGGIYSTGNIVAYSDARKKTNVVTIESALEKILKLRGVYYNRIIDDASNITPEIAEKRQTGLIAQETMDIFPEVVTYDETNDEFGISYGSFAGLFIEGFKEQEKIINKQREEINFLKEELEKIKDLILNNKG